MFEPTIKEVIRQNKRFIVYRVNYEGRSAIYKTGASGNSNATADLQTEAWWITQHDQLALHSDINIRPPKLLDSGKNWILTEDFGQKTLTDPNQPVDQEIEPHFAVFIEFLIALDKLVLKPTQSYESVPNTNSAPYNNLKSKIDIWTAELIENNYIEPEIVTDAKKLIDEYAMYVEPRLQHGDFVPWHIFELAGGKLGLVDGEHASYQKPRHYDACYLYTRLFTKVDSTAARNFLKFYLKALDEDEVILLNQLWPVMTLRAMGVLRDSYLDKKQFDYEDLAKELLQICLTKDKTVLLSS